MFPWLLLKLLPNIALYIHLQNRIGLYSILSMAVCLTVMREKSRFHDFKKNQQLMLLTFVLFGVSLALNLGETVLTGSTAEIFPIGRGFFLLITLPYIINSKRNAVQFISLFVGILFLVQLGHLVSGVELASAGAIANAYNIDDQRNVGITDNPWTLSYNSIVAFGIGLITAYSCKSIYLRAVGFSLIILSIANLLLTITRGALVGLPLVILGWVIEMSIIRQENKIKPNIRLLFVSILTALICIFAINFTIAQLLPNEYNYYLSLWLRRIEPGVDGESSRMASNLSGIKMFFDHPFIGVGWECAYFQSVSYGAGWYTTVHNGIIQASAQGGVIGLLFSIFLLIIIPWSLFWKYRYLRGSFVFLGCILAVFSYNMIASNYMCDAHWDLMAFWMGFVASRSPIPEKTL